jgi:hypothetical protein
MQFLQVQQPLHTGQLACSCASESLVPSWRLTRHLLGVEGGGEGGSGVRG